MEINEKKLKEILKEEREEFQRYIKVLSEKSDSNFKLVSEQYSSIKETLDSHTEMIASVKETLDMHTAQIFSVKETLDNNTEMTASTKEDVEIIKIDIGLIKNSLKKKADAEEFSGLVRRVAVLETKARAR